MKIALADLAHPAVIGLLELHLREATANSPADSMFALDLSGLRDPAMTVWAAWDGDALLGLGALREIDARHGEVKSMRTAPGYQRRGVGGALLAHITGEAVARGYARLSLETGTNDAFAPARAMYEAAGFEPSGPFGDYVLTEFNKCYSRSL